jgi:hypothetical protein
MNLTDKEIAERLKQLPELDLLDLLGLTSEDIVDRCLDIIENKADFLQQQVDWE